MKLHTSNIGNLLYVGGSGPGNYTTIQSAITASNDGDTVYVYSGVYNETLIVSKSITLMGEDKEATIVDGNKQDSVVKVTRDGVIVKGFTLKESRECGDNWDYNVVTISSRKNVTVIDNIIRIGLQSGYQDLTAGVYLGASTNCLVSNNIIINIEKFGDTMGVAFSEDSTNNTITDNEISKHHWGIYISRLDYSDYNILSNNSIHDNNRGIDIGGDYTTIYGNEIFDNRFSGIQCWDNNENIITHNIITNNGEGVEFDAGLDLLNSHNNLIANNIISNNKPVGLSVAGSHSNQISENHLEENTGFGLLLQFSYNTNINKNNFVKNSRNVYFEYNLPILRRIFMPNIWDGNYWSNQILKGVLPKLILGQAVMTIFIQVPWIQVDWHPSSELIG